MEIFPYSMYSIRTEKNTASDTAVTGVSETVFQIGFVDSGSTAVFSQDFQPGDIILMAVVMLHGKFTRHIPSEYYRRTVDAVMFQKFSVGDLLF